MWATLAAMNLPLLGMVSLPPSNVFWDGLWQPGFPTYDVEYQLAIFMGYE